MKLLFLFELYTLGSYIGKYVYQQGNATDTCLENSTPCDSKCSIPLSKDHNLNINSGKSGEKNQSSIFGEIGERAIRQNTYKVVLRNPLFKIPRNWKKHGTHHARATIK
ncbi:hypothetical protein [Solidesulfovibrio fructosivorans]|uniref:hypothetical protein n=1 Tax=Solidesulfovibrio fructosivorans TaxID=878 RepID=UPI00117CAA5D|nr:hypothetical protein [Solidesulfovibrio fructosivorans]